MKNSQRQFGFAALVLIISTYNRFNNYCGWRTGGLFFPEKTAYR